MMDVGRSNWGLLLTGFPHGNIFKNRGYADVIEREFLEGEQ
jgi:hypothetical protein